MTTKLPPQDLAAERATLGSMMLGGGKVNAVREIISADDFHADTHATIFRSILAVHDRTNGDVDALMVIDHLQAAGTLADVGGAVYVNECMETVHYHDHATHYAEIVGERSRRRKAIAIGEKLIASAYDLTNDDRQVVESAHDAAMRMAETLQVKNSRPKPLSEFVFGVIDEYSKGRSPCFHWGIHDIDQLIGGVAPGELIIIGARPSCGKTMIAMQWLDEASRKGIPSLVISEEMSGAALGHRNLSSVTALDPAEWMGSVDRLRFDAREHFTNRAPVLVAEKCATIGKAEREIARAVQSHKVRIVAVDYAQLLAGNGDTKAERVGDVSARLKAAAMRHEIVVLLLAQLNRQLVGRPDQTPQLSDLKDSGGLEQDCDVCLMPHWPIKLSDSYPDPTEYRVYVRKNRNRGIGDHVVTMRIRPDRQRVESVASASFDHADDWESSR